MKTSYQQKIKEFKFENVNSSVRFVESMKVKEGVYCDVYEFIADNDKDLGIVTVKPNSATPRQKVLKGTRTIEGYISGIGELIIEKADGKKKTYTLNGDDTFQIDVMIGEVMQWRTTGNVDLIFYEICFPPYADGRYQNLNDKE